MSYALLTNSDLAAQPAGSVVRRGLLANTCLLAQADSFAHCQSLVGTRLESIVAGASGTVAGLADGSRVVLDGVASAGDAIYLSAATAGSGTNIVPTIKVLLGYAYAVELVGGTYYAQLIVFAASLGTDGLVLPFQLPGAVLAETYIFPQFTGPGVYSGTHVLNAKTKKFFFWLIGAGGAGGGSLGGSAGNISVGSGGGGGGYREGVVTVVPGVTGVDWVIGQGGAGVSGATGNDGTQSTLTYNSVLVAQCLGGFGGMVMASGNTPATIDGGTLGNSFPADTIAVAGGNGTSGLRWSGTVGLAGMGGFTVMGAWSGGSRASEGDGATGFRHGGGGGGSFSATVTKTGGAGRDGALVITEFS